MGVAGEVSAEPQGGWAWSGLVRTIGSHLWHARARVSGRSRLQHAPYRRGAVPKYVEVSRVPSGQPTGSGPQQRHAKAGTSLLLCIWAF
jgi:hypothetical protein